MILKHKTIFFFLLLLLPTLTNSLSLDDNSKIDIESNIKTEFTDNTLRIYEDSGSYLQLRDYYSYSYLRKQDNIINLKYPEYDTQIFETNTSIGEAIEYLVIYNSKPSTNLFELEIKGSGYTFYYQDSLIKENTIKGNYGNETHLFNSTGSLIAHRSDDILYSYAVYKDNFKVFHILRPYAYDSTGLFTWCDMSIEKDNLKIITPQSFLDSAKYPIYHTPTFGKTSIGGSTFTFADDTIYGSKFNLPVNANITSITLYTTGTHRDGWCGLYNLTGVGDNTPYALMGETEHEWSTEGWHTWDYVTPVTLNSNDYWIVGYQTLYDKTGYYDTTFNNTFSYYDAGISNFPSTLNDWNVYFYNYTISIYANYTALAPTPPPPTPPETFIQFDYISLILNILVVLIGIISLYKPIVFIIGLGLSSVLIIGILENTLTIFISSLTIICLLVNISFAIIGMVRNRGM